MSDFDSLRIPGNSPMRDDLMLPGAGTPATTPKVVAQVRWIDAASSEVLAEDKLDGKVVLGGLVKGESIGATRGLAKEVVKKTKKKFF